MKKTSAILPGAILSMAGLFLGASANAGPEQIESKTVAPVIEPAFSWTSFYIGGHVGVAWNTYDFRDHDVDYFASDEFDTLIFTGGTIPTVLTYLDPGQSNDPAGSMMGGGQVGYQHQFGHFVVGVEGDFSSMSDRSDWVQFTGTQTFSNIDVFGDSGSVTLTSSRQARTDWSGSVRLRAGYAINRLQLYATGGVSFLEAGFTAIDQTQGIFFDITPADPLFTPNHTVRTDGSDVLVGWTAGVGADWAVTRLISLGVEYRHSDWGDHNFATPAVFPLGATTTHTEFAGDQITFRLNFLLSHLFGH